MLPTLVVPLEIQEASRVLSPPNRYAQQLMLNSKLRVLLGESVEEGLEVELGVHGVAYNWK